MQQQVHRKPRVETRAARGRLVATGRTGVLRRPLDLPRFSNNNSTGRRRENRTVTTARTRNPSSNPTQIQPFKGLFYSDLCKLQATTYIFLQLITSSFSVLQLIISLTKVLHLLTSPYVFLHFFTSPYSSLYHFFFCNFALQEFCCCKFVSKKIFFCKIFFRKKVEY